MGNILSKPVRKFNFSMQEQRLIREARYIDRKIRKPSSVKKEIGLIMRQTVLYSLFPKIDYTNGPATFGLCES